MFKPLNLFKTELTAVLEVDGTSLPIPPADAQRICTALGDECVPCDDVTLSANFTRLVISYSGYYEIVKVISCSGGVPILQRGDECTTPLKFPVGACVYFVWTAANLECAIIQVASGYPLGDCDAGCGSIDLGEGVPGPAGEEGPQGPKGDDGDVGATGPAGDTGPQGVAGPAGPTGQNGLNGLDGAQGPQGVAGPTGLNGVDGATGAQGPQGQTGPAGVKGDPGEDGKSAYGYYVDGGGEQTPAQFSTCLAETCPAIPPA